MTTDNGANITCALHRSLAWPRLPCFGHNLHLAVTNSIKDDDRVNRALGLCRKIVSAFSFSWKKKRDLAEIQQSLNLPLHSLKSDCTTRWGSTQVMIDRILEQKDAIRQVLQSDSKTKHLKLSWQDLDVLESIKSAFGPLDEFTDALSGESEVTASSIKAVLYVLETDVLKGDTNDSTLTKDIKKFVMGYLVNKYEPADIQNLLNKASFLDPRFCCMYLNDDAKELVKQMVTDEGELLLSGLKSSESVSEEHAPCNPPPSKKRKLGAWLEKARLSAQDEDQRESLLTSKQCVQKEIEQYEKLPRADASSHPLEWWKVHCKQFPALSLLAKKYLCICASSSSSERVFSTSGHIVSKRRSCLKPEKINMLVFLAKNL